jgi:hypothetical protein
MVSPGNVAFQQRPVNGFSNSAQRYLYVSPPYVYSMFALLGIPEAAVADMQVWRSNGTSWVKSGPIDSTCACSKRVQSAIPTNAYGVGLPNQLFVWLPYGGLYTVTVTFHWWSYGGLQGYKTVWFNSASDYLPSGSSYLAQGGIYIP